MLKLEIPIILLTCIGALYGIWSKSEINKVVASTSTTITLLGMVLTLTVAIGKSTNARKAAVVAEQRRQEELVTTLAAADLNDLEIVWEFANCPAEVRDMITLGEVMVDTRFLSDDEVARMPAETRTLIRSAWLMDVAVSPMLTAIAHGDVSLNKLYEGEDARAAIKRWTSAGEPDSDWVESIGSNISYSGPRYDVMFPLNPRSNAVIALGKKADDVVASEPTLPWQEEYPSLFEETNYGFRSSIDQVDGGIAFRWHYDRSSLLRSAVRPANASITAGFPKQFSIFIVHRPISRDDYLVKAPRPYRGGTLGNQPRAGSKWNDTSVLKIYVNGLDAPHYTFEVRRVGTQEYAPDRGAYDSAEVEFEYTEFVAVLKSVT